MPRALQQQCWVRELFPASTFPGNGLTCYWVDSRLALVDLILQLREAPTLSEDKVNQYVNALAPYLSDQDKRRQICAKLTTAEA